MSVIWISKEKIQTLWGMLHNIKVRMQENIKSPVVMISGRGLRAAINIDLPKLAGSSEDYNGYLKVIKISDTKIKIVDGLDPDAVVCWRGIINKFDVESVTATELTISGNAWIYLKAVPVEYVDQWVDATATIEQSAAMPVYEAEVFKHLISRVTFADGAITGFTQESSFTQGVIFKECE